MHRPTWLEVGRVRSRKRMRNVDAKFADGAKMVNAMYSTDNAQAANLPKADVGKLNVRSPHTVQSCAQHVISRLALRKSN